MQENYGKGLENLFDVSISISRIIGKFDYRIDIGKNEGYRKLSSIIDTPTSYIYISWVTLRFSAQLPTLSRANSHTRIRKLKLPLVVNN